MKNQTKLAALLIQNGWAAIETKTLTHVEGKITLCPEYFVGQTQVDYDIIVDPDIALENLAESVYGLTAQSCYAAEPDEVCVDYLLYTLSDGVLQCFFARESAARPAIADAIEWGMGVAVIDGKVKHLPSGQVAGTAHQRRSYAESWAIKLV